MGIAMIRHGRANMTLAARITAASQAVAARQQHDPTQPPQKETPADPPPYEARPSHR
ncbi:hypothetical protein [Nonomuraea maheshkhaliensis]|uniref:hypothetical protein n=1 Tax=Nonomuraea maheshkhaliensis TaxID=419590 RepID=UPI0031FA3C27